MIYIGSLADTVKELKPRWNFLTGAPIAIQSLRLNSFQLIEYSLPACMTVALLPYGLEASDTFM